MADISIDRMKLRLAGFVEEDARRLAHLIAEGLAGSALPGDGKSVPAMNVNVSAPAGASMKSISERVVADIIGQLKRSM